MTHWNYSQKTPPRKTPRAVPGMPPYPRQPWVAAPGPTVGAAQGGCGDPRARAGPDTPQADTGYTEYERTPDTREGGPDPRADADPNKRT